MTSPLVFPLQSPAELTRSQGRRDSLGGARPQQVAHIARVRCQLALPCCQYPLTIVWSCVGSLYYNDIGPKGGEALGEALKTNSTLENLKSVAHRACPSLLSIPLDDLSMCCWQLALEQAECRGGRAPLREPEGQQGPHLAQVRCPTTVPILVLSIASDVLPCLTISHPSWCHSLQANGLGNSVREQLQEAAGSRITLRL